MKLPEKSWYSIDEVATRWECSKDDVCHLIQTTMLLPSYFLEGVECRIKTMPIDFESDEDSTVQNYSGLVSPALFLADIVNKYISVSKKWCGNLEGDLLIAGPPQFRKENSGIEEVLIPIDPVPVVLDDILIARDELKRFERVQNSHPHKGQTIQAPDYLHPRQENTLLTIIGALLDVIVGEYASKDVVRHPSIKNQADLIVRLAELGEPGLSKSNLEKYFSRARSVRSSC